MKKYILVSLLFGIISIFIQGVMNHASSSETTMQDVIIIGNKNLPFNTLTYDELKDIFQRKKTMWEDGQKISFALLDGGRAHQFFVRHYIQKTPAQYHRYWKKLVFSGRGVPPMTFRSEKSLMAHVALTAGAIGYVSTSTRLSGVKKIQIVEKHPSQAGNTGEDKQEAPPQSERSSTALSAGKTNKPSGNLFSNFF